MVTKNQIKLILGLHQKKFRQLHNLFIAEGEKVITELLISGLEVDQIYNTTNLFSDKYKYNTTLISDADLKKISALSDPNNCLAVFKIPVPKKIISSGLIVALDDIRDPGNLGAILRLCDWFGIEQVVCSEQTVDLYNPKVVQATMGSISRVNVNYLDLKTFIETSKLPVYGTFMTGENLYQTRLKSAGILVFGNEANGISDSIEKLVQTKLSIPRFGKLQRTESLNVATATAVFLSEFKRFNEN